MTLAAFRAYCAGLPGFSKDPPFGPDVLAFRVGGRIIARLDVDRFGSVNLKCDPERTIELRERYPGITPGPHLNKRHWNTVRTDGSVPHRLLLQMARHSHDRVRAALPRKVRDDLP